MQDTKNTFEHMVTDVVAQDPKVLDLQVVTANKGLIEAQATWQKQKSACDAAGQAVEASITQNESQARCAGSASDQLMF